MGFPEFVIVIASIMALNPLAMDMMLPARCCRSRQAFSFARSPLSASCWWSRRAVCSSRTRRS
jgi:hypothetical protein